MKKIVLLLMLLQSITGNLYAQLSLKKRSLKMEEMSNFRQSYFVDLKTYNSMRVDVFAPHGTPFTANIDSLMNVLVETIATIDDSLPSEFESRTITVSTYDTTARTVSWSSKPADQRQLMLQGIKKMETKVNQDTIILNVFKFVSDDKSEPPFLRISFYLNNLHQLQQFNSGRFNQLFQSLEPENYTKWTTSKEGYLYLKSDPSVQILKAADPLQWRKGYSFDLSISAQNYKDRFVPSVNVGIGMVRTRNNIQAQYWIGNEYNFTFGRNANGEPRTFVNEFITLSYKTFRTPGTPINIIGVFPNIKVGYLYRRKDLNYDKNTFKLGIGQFTIGSKKLRVEPTFYFHDAFRGLTPSFRITQSF
jgi:hypothetical protein